MRACLLLSLIILPVSAQGALIQAGYLFNANDNSTVTGFSQTVTALGQGGETLTFDFDVAISSTTGSVIDTSTGASGISQTAGANLQAGNEITFSLSISNIVTSVASWLPDLSTLSFRYLNLQGANGPTSAGTIITPAGSQSFLDIDNGEQFFGHIPSGQIIGGNDTSIFGGTQGFIDSSTGAFAANQTFFGTGLGFSIPDTNISNGGAGVVTTFTFRSDSPGFRIGAVGFEVTANPEPSSIVLGCVALLFCATPFARRRLKRLIAGDAPATVA